MGFPTQATCLSCGAAGPFPCSSTGNDETSFEVYGRYDGNGMFKCRKCGAFNLMKFRLLFPSSFVGTIPPDDARYVTIIKMHDRLFSVSGNGDDRLEEEEITETLRRLGKSITSQDLIDVNSSGGSGIEFASLDRATRIVFDRRVKAQAKLLALAWPAAVQDNPRGLLFTVGGHVFAGFIMGRRLFNTHNSMVEFSGDASNTVEKVALLESFMNQIKVADLLHDAGEQFEDFFERWAAHHACCGVYADIPTAGRAYDLVYLHLLNGWSLSIAEYQMTLRY